MLIPRDLWRKSGQTPGKTPWQCSNRAQHRTGWYFSTRSLPVSNAAAEKALLLTGVKVVQTRCVDSEAADTS